jgi:diguanylate cyclase (GGDEF)-like protein
VALGDLLDLLLDFVLEIMEADVASVMLRDPERRELFIQSARGLAEDVVRTARAPLGQSLAGLVAQTGEHILIRPETPRSELAYLLRRPDVKAALIVPIKGEQEIYGTINVAARREVDEFTEGRARLLHALGRQAGELLDDMTEAERSRRLLEEMRSIVEAGRALALAREVRVIAELALATIRRLTGSRRCAVLLSEDPTGHLRALVVHGMRENEVERVSRLVTATELAEAGRAGQTVVVAAAVETATEEGEVRRLTQALCIPLTAEGRLVGAICLCDDPPPRLGRHEKRLVSVLAEQTGLAVHTTRQLQRLQEMAYVDELTGLNNLRYWRQRLHEEAERAKREGSAFGVILFDLDDLKRYNDAYGHLVGDQVLRLLADALRAELRDMDVVTRYGGEEFTVLLPGAGRDNALAVAERVRRAAERLPLAQRLGVEEQLTVSAGVAVFPLDGKTERDVLDAADRACYEAKRRGKNTVCSAHEVRP